MPPVFEDKDLTDRAVLAAEKVIHGGPELDEDKAVAARHVDDAGANVTTHEKRV